MARVAALLEPYFDKGTPVSIKMIEMEDWAEAMKDSPYWAIEKACRWWKSEENPEKRRRPIEGDIMARIRVEMGAVRAAQIKLASPSFHRKTKGEIRQPPTPEEMEQRRVVAQEVMSHFKANSFRRD